MAEVGETGRFETLFVTRVYRARLARHREVNEEIERAARSLAVDDEAGIAWCAEHGYPGYTSYASLDDLPWRFPVFADLEARLAPHVRRFAKASAFDLGGGRLVLDDIWVNVLPASGFHTGHIHPHSVVSGTYYVAVPAGAAALKFEDPRLGLMMAAPPRKGRVPRDSQTFVTMAPKAGDVLLWESWLRHEVPVNRSGEDRISVSFNYRWA